MEGSKLSNFKIKDQFYKMVKINGLKLHPNTYVYFFLFNNNNNNNNNNSFRDGR
jgi:hypothetical protein